jgi:hypothetical protein
MIRVRRARIEDRKLLIAYQERVCAVEGERPGIGPRDSAHAWRNGDRFAVARLEIAVEGKTHAAAGLLEGLRSALYSGHDWDGRGPA